MSERELIQLTLSPEEAVWLFAAANTGHLIAAAIGADACGKGEEKAKLQTLANVQAQEIFVSGENIEPSIVLARLEKLIKNTTRAAVFTDEA